MADVEELLRSLLGTAYDVERELPGGGMSRLFLATERALDRQVVVKVLPPDLLSSTTVARFRREIAITVKLQHPHILPVLGAGGNDDLLYYIAPYIPGESLRERIAREGALPAADAERVLRDMCDALVFAHARDVAHRDIKPGNVLLHDGHAILADFGIARALDPAADPITLTETQPGTPAYMAPERPSDERADLFGLGMVGYEMLTGRLPRPTMRIDASSILATRKLALRDDPAERDRVSALAAVVARAIAAEPAARFGSATELAAALAEAHTEPLRATRRLRRRLLIVAASVVGVAVLGVGGYAARTVGSARARALDSSRYIVLPFTQPRGAAPGAPSGDLVAQHLADALGEWRDVSLPEPRAVSEALERLDGEPLRTPAALGIARELGAGNVVWGEAWADGDSVRLRATLYSAGDGRAVRTRVTAFPARAQRQHESYRTLANALLRDGEELPWISPDGGHAPSLTAWRAYDSARVALRTWSVPEAERLLRATVGADSMHAGAHLWLAQLLTWTDAPAAEEERRAIARRALELRERLPARDIDLATALVAMAEQRFGDACGAYERIIARDSLDFAGWYGIGDCQSRDPIVVPDARSASGYAFRGSYHGAALAYERALSSLPAGARPDFAYARLRRVLYTETNRQRFGRGADDGSTFRAYPSLVADTIAFTPYLAGSSWRGEVIPPTLIAAVEGARLRLARALRGWVRAEPANPRAHAALAEVLEAMGHISESGSEEATALREIRRARELTTDSLDVLSHIRSEVRMLIKNGDVSAARALADSALAAWPDPPAAEGNAIASLAALTGRVRLAARISREISATPSELPTLPSGVPMDVPPAIARERAAMLTYAAAGVCDSLRHFERRILSLVAAHYGGSPMRRKVTDALLGRPLSVGVPCLGPAAVSSIAETSDRLVRMQQAVARDDRRTLRAHLDTLRAQRGEERAADVAMEYVFGEAWLLAAIGDTTAALGSLDPALDALPVSGLHLLGHPVPAAALPRAMALCAELAARRGDRYTASRWASAVVTLWSSADPELQPVVERMRRLARP